MDTVTVVLSFILMIISSIWAIVFEGRSNHTQETDEHNTHTHACTHTHATPTIQGLWVFVLWGLS